MREAIERILHPFADTMKVLAGAGSAFIEHEADHVLFDLLFDAHPFVKSVQFGPVPFFAKIIHVFMDMDKMVGGQFAEGLGKLKAAAEK